MGIENLDYCAKLGLDVFYADFVFELCESGEHLEPDLGIFIFQKALVNWDDVVDCAIFSKLTA